MNKSFRRFLGRLKIKLKEINFEFFITFCAGIYKKDGPFDVLIDISQIKELHTIPSTNEVCNYNISLHNWKSLVWIIFKALCKS